MRRHGRFIVNPDAPEPYGICDRHGGMVALSELKFQTEVSGTGIRTTNLRVCSRCTDRHAQFLRTIVIPPDPPPVRDPRPIPPYGNVGSRNWDDGGEWDDGSKFDTDEDSGL